MASGIFLAPYVGVQIEPQVVQWSAVGNPARWNPDGARSMPVSRFLRYGYQGGRLGKRMRRLRREAYEAATRGAS